MSCNCPACGTSTKLVRWDDVAGFECEACGGHFIPSPELSRFFDSHSLAHRFDRLVQNARAAPESARNLSCSHCDAASFRTLQTGMIELDACASCGSLYFDADEATRYFRQARFKATGDNAVKLGVESVERMSVIAHLLTWLPFP